MPVSFSIKNVPDELAARLRKRARESHRSVQGELLAILEAAVIGRPMTLREIQLRARELDLATPEDSVDIVRRDRDAR